MQFRDLNCLTQRGRMLRGSPEILTAQATDEREIGWDCKGLVVLGESTEADYMTYLLHSSLEHSCHGIMVMANIIKWQANGKELRMEEPRAPCRDVVFCF